MTMGSQIGGDDIVTNVTVMNGLLTVTVNDNDEFGMQAFDGSARYLEVAVQCVGDTDATTLSPRQAIHPVPYAQFADRFAGYQNVITVAKSKADFTSVSAAVDAIGVYPKYPPPSSTNRYVIFVAPGIYEDEHVVMKEYVDIEGSGRGVTTITSLGGANGIQPESATLVGAANAELRHVTVENISGNPGIQAVR